MRLELVSKPSRTIIRSDGRLHAATAAFSQCASDSERLWTLDLVAATSDRSGALIVDDALRRAEGAGFDLSHLVKVAHDGMASSVAAPPPLSASEPEPEPQ